MKKLTGAGKEMKKLVRNLDKNNAYDSEEEENPYLSEVRDITRLPAGAKLTCSSLMKRRMRKRSNRLRRKKRTRNPNARGQAVPHQALRNRKVRRRPSRRNNRGSTARHHPRARGPPRPAWATRSSQSVRQARRLTRPRRSRRARGARARSVPDPARAPRVLYTSPRRRPQTTTSGAPRMPGRLGRRTRRSASRHPRRALALVARRRRAARWTRRS